MVEWAKFLTPPGIILMFSGFLDDIGRWFDSKNPEMLFDLRCHIAFRMGDSILGGFHLHLENPKAAVPSTVDSRRAKASSWFFLDIHETLHLFWTSQPFCIPSKMCIRLFRDVFHSLHSHGFWHLRKWLFSLSMFGTWESFTWARHKLLWWGNFSRRVEVTIANRCQVHVIVTIHTEQTERTRKSGNQSGNMKLSFEIQTFIYDMYWYVFVLV